ncbi:hypothetical protein BC936DRAFT_143281 [Jimgerdemannia flammicorona]|uniref:RETREG1-3/ARL6IP-like N-terminal reticulon-homology domain-containing protein n=1 Tax=Jimgerdemannia flammicorona TaxID=994334 RepID=A0A433DE11_9FUNG|nr:hypothetical protein BC936DRAFT_143281 [Jimgerdemannia flammicorona]
MPTSSHYVRSRLQHPVALSIAPDKARHCNYLKSHLEDYEDVVVAFWNDVLLFRSPGAAAAVYGGVGAVFWLGNAGGWPFSPLTLYVADLIAFLSPPVSFISFTCHINRHGHVDTFRRVIAHSNLPLVSVLALGFASYTVVTEAVLPLETKEWLDQTVDEYERYVSIMLTSRHLRKQSEKLIRISSSGSSNIYHRRSHRHQRLPLRSSSMPPPQSLDAIIDILADMSVSVVRSWEMMRALKARYPGLYVPATCCMAAQVSVLGTKVPGYVIVGMLVYSALLTPAMQFYGFFRWLQQFYHLAVMWTENHARQVNTANRITSSSTTCTIPSTFPTLPTTITSYTSPQIIAASNQDDTDLQMTDLLNLAPGSSSTMVESFALETDLDAERDAEPEAVMIQTKSVEDELEYQDCAADAVIQKGSTNALDTEYKADEKVEQPALEVDNQVLSETVMESPNGTQSVEATIEAEVINESLGENSDFQLARSPLAGNLSVENLEITTPILSAAVGDMDIDNESHNKMIMGDGLKDDQEHNHSEQQEAIEHAAYQQSEEVNQHVQVEEDLPAEDEDDYDSDWEKDFTLPSPSASLPSSVSSANGIASLATLVRSPTSSSFGFVRSVGRKLGVGRMKGEQHSSEDANDGSSIHVDVEEGEPLYEDETSIAGLAVTNSPGSVISTSHLLRGEMERFYE